MQPAYVRDFKAKFDDDGRATNQKKDRTRVEFTRCQLPRPHDKDGEETGLEDEVDIALISTPGDTQSVAAVRVNQEIKMRYPQQWLAYTKGDIQPVDGTPIEQMPGVNTAFAMQLKALGVFSIEDLAELEPAHAKKFIGGLAWSNKAKEYLTLHKEHLKAKESEEIKSLRAELAEIKALIRGGQIPVQDPDEAKEISGGGDDPAINAAPKRRGRPPIIQAA